MLGSSPLPGGPPPRKRASEARQCRLEVERLEDRLLPALVAGEVVPLLPPGGPPAPAPVTLSTDDVGKLLQRAAAATANDSAIVAVVDRNGRVLGVRVEGGVDPAITSNAATETFAIDGAISEARTGAFFSSDAAPLTSRTVRFISQSTVTQREVDSSPDVTDRNSPQYGPGFVAPIGVGGHFPPNVPFTPQVDLFGIEHTNRDNITTPSRFNVPTQFIPPGQGLTTPLSYGVLTGLDPGGQSRGIATLPGGIPLYKDGELVGGIGVFFPGKTGYASEENSSLSSNYDPTKPDLSLEAEFIAFAAAGGSSGAGYRFGDLGGVAPPAGFDLPFGRIDLVGITLDIYGPGGLQGPQNLVNAAQAFGINGGDPNSSAMTVVPTDAMGNLLVDSTGDFLLNGQPVPEGWLVTPHDGGGVSAAEVQQIITQGIAEANVVRAQIRLPIGERTRMVFAVTDSQGDVLGLYRMPDATVFSLDVAVAKARNVAYYDDPTQLLTIDQLPGVPAGTAFTNRTFRYLSLPNFPEGINGKPPAPFSSLINPSIDRNTALNVGAPLPPSAYQGELLYDAFNPNTNFHDPNNPANQNGVVFFPGSSAVYNAAGGQAQIVGGFGVSGDGVDQDDVVTAAGITGFGAPPTLQVDQNLFQGVRLPYQKFPRNPEG